MQYHFNGFNPGDPACVQPKLDVGNKSKLDVAIVGCGPAGLTLAAQLATIGGLNVRIFDRKAGALEVGQADGIACRSMEMFEAFGFAEKVLKESYWVNETSFWRPGTEGTGLLRADRIQDVEDDLSHQPHVILNQARVHDFYLEVMRNSASHLQPDYSRELVSLTRSEHTEFPVTAVFNCLDEPGKQETVQAKYVVGCDGARSTVRQSISQKLKGEAARQLWGVMDVLVVTDFPDIRLKCAIQSAAAGSGLIIPREGGYMVRIYIELDELHGDERASDRDVTPELLEQKARAILSPYTFDVKEVAWWSAYEIGQRVCDTFDDAEAAPGHTPRIFIAGDACHTHSPKAGQGMNVSMADAFNLGWKLASVLHGQAEPTLLHSYSIERQSMARELIDFDRDMARLFSEKTKSADGANGADGAAQFQRYFQKHARYTAGVETCYAPSLITDGNARQQLATGQLVGKRFHSAPVIRLADAKHLQLSEVLKADGRWRLLAFADRADTGQPGGAIELLCAYLQHSPESPLNWIPLQGHAPPEVENEGIIDIRVIFQQNHRDLDIGDMPPLLLPAKGKFGLTDYEKIYAPALKQQADIFDLRGIDRDKGALVVVRPDQYVATVLPISAHAAITEFFSAFMKVSSSSISATEANNYTP